MMMMMSITPEKKKNDQPKYNQKAKNQIKKTGEKIPEKEQVVIEDKQESGETKLICEKVSFSTLVKILLIVFIPLLVFILIYSIVAFSNAENEDWIISSKDIMKTDLKSGQKFQSSSLELKTSDMQTIDLAINEIQQKKRLLQTSFIKQVASKIISYFHKNTQISISIDDSFRVQVQIPGDTGLDFAIGDINNQCLKQLEKLPIQLPITMKQILQKLTNKKVAVSSCVAYDGVFNNKTNDYTLLNEKKSYHPESFAKLKPYQKDLIGGRPQIKNCSNIIEVSTKITSVISSLISNFKRFIFENKESLKPLIGNIEDKITVKKVITPSEQVKRCTRVGKEILRCCEDAWDNLKVTNLKEAKPLQVYQIIINIQ